MSVKYNWIKKPFLAIGPYPDTKDIKELHNLGFKSIINFTEDNRNEEFLKDNFVTYLNIAIEDFGVPGFDDLWKFVRFIKFNERINLPTFMHCIAGRGRSGTFAAIYLLMNGYKVLDAIKEVRKIVDGAIETEEQERFVYFSEDLLPALLNKEDQYFYNAKKIIEVLRKKCPWDKVQTHETLINSLLDEAYEVVEAIREKDNLHLREEIGDLLIQPLIQAQISEDNKEFSIYDSIDDMIEKLINRHPHVFGSKTVITPNAVVNQWSQIKQTENNNSSYQPIEQIMDISKEAADYGFDWNNPKDILKKFEEELKETEKAIEGGNLREIEEELGDAFFALFNIARFLKIDPNKSLERGRRKFEQRFRLVQRLITKDNKDPKKLSSEELDIYWNKAKEILGN
jgi:MazG family protein